MELYDKVPFDDPEVKKVTVRAVIHTSESSNNHVGSFKRLMNYHSSWKRLRKSVAWFLKIKKRKLIQHKTQLEKQAAETCLLSEEDLQEVEVGILKFIQRNSLHQKSKS